MLKDNLFHCPFCGSSATFKEIDCGDYWIYYVQCNKCDIKGETYSTTIHHEASMKKAIKKWNTRVNSKHIKLLQYENLRKHFRKMTDDILGKDYYNMGMDVYECDRIICEDITKQAKRFSLIRYIKSLFFL
jgi:Lar family restriction alleviation protein